MKDRATWIAIGVGVLIIGMMAAAFAMHQHFTIPPGNNSL